QLQLAVRGGGVERGDGIRTARRRSRIADETGAHHAHMAEGIEVTEPEAAGLHAAHRETDDGTAGAIGARAVLAVDQRDDVLEDVALVQREIAAEGPGIGRRDAGAV